jgi:hypothetical protein
MCITNVWPAGTPRQICPPGSLCIFGDVAVELQQCYCHQSLLYIWLCCTRLVLNLIHSFFSFFFVFANLHLSSLHLYIYCLSSLLVYFFHLCILTFYFVFTNQRLSSLCLYVCCLCMSIFFMFALSLSLLCLQKCIFPLCNDTIKPTREHELVRMGL